MATVNLQIRTNKDYTIFKKTGQKNENMSRIVNLLAGLNAGSLVGEVFVSGSTASTLVAATATATITYADIAADQTITLFGVTLTCKASGAVADQFNKETDATVTAANLVTAANANTTIAKHCVASSALGVVTFTLNTKGSIGNFVEDITKSAAGIALVQWAGGVGGVEASQTQVR